MHTRSTATVHSLPPTYPHVCTHTHTHSHVCAYAYIHSHIYKDAVNIRGRCMARCCDTSSRHAGHAYKWSLSACIDAWILRVDASLPPTISDDNYIKDTIRTDERRGSLMGQYSRQDMLTKRKKHWRCSDARSERTTNELLTVDC